MSLAFIGRTEPKKPFEASDFRVSTADWPCLGWTATAEAKKIYAGIIREAVLPPPELGPLHERERSSAKSARVRS